MKKIIILLLCISSVLAQHQGVQDDVNIFLPVSFLAIIGVLIWISFKKRKI